MGIINYQSQEEMDEAFEDLEEYMQEKAYLEGQIEDVRAEIDDAEDRVVELKSELADLEKTLEELNDGQLD